MRNKFLLVAIALIIGVTGCALDSVSEPRRPDPAMEPTLVPTLPSVAKPRFVVEKSDVVDRLTFAGRVAPAEERELRMAAPGIVGDVFVSVGDRVNEGDPLLTLDQEIIKSELSDLRAELTAIQTEVAEQEKTILSQQRLLEIAVERAQLKLAYAREIAALSPSSAQALEIELLELDVEEAELALVLFGTADAVTDGRIDDLKSQIAQFEMQMAAAVLVAPQAGEILALSVEVGDQMRVNQVVGLIGETDNLEIKADLNDRILNQLTEGTTVSISSNRLDEPMIGTIDLLPAPYGGASDQSVHIILRGIEESGLGLRMPVMIDYVVQERLDVPWLPPEAIREFSGRRFVLVEEPNGDQRRVDLRLGLVTEDRVEILEGLEGGETVIGP